MQLSSDEIAELIDRYAAALGLWLARRCPWPEDAMQEAFCRLAALDPPPERPVAWLYHAARNFAEKQRLSESRRRARQNLLARPESIYSDPAAAIEAEEAAARAVALVNKLPDELREVVIARIWGQLTLAEVARLCNVSPATAFRRLNSALEQLRIELTPPCPTNAS